MKKYFLILLICQISLLSFAQNNRSEQFDSLFTALHTKNSFNGNVLIAEEGKVIFEKSYGFANEETKQKLNSETLFELASVSKQFTAMAIVLLHKQGKLNYDDDMTKFLPEMSHYEDITIRNLVHHTGGLPDYMEIFEEHWDKSKFVVNVDIVNEFARLQPEIVFKPNEKFEYSNTGYSLLGLIIERASGQTFEDYLKENIFKPLKMDKTFVYRSRFKPQVVENYAMGYVTDSLGRKVLTDSFGKDFYTYYLDGIVGDGMVNSTTGDLLKWDRALYTDILIDENDRELIFTPGKTSDGEQTKYGFGWIIRELEEYGKIVSHSGSWAGYLTFIDRHLTNDKTIIILQNNAMPQTRIPNKEVARILYNLPPVADKKLELSTEDLDKYLGVYSNPDFPLKITISKSENTLIAKATGQSEIPLDAYDNHTFKFDPADIKLVFKVEENSMELTQGGMNLVFLRE